MTNIDLTKLIGTENFPNNVNDVLKLVETLASQRITAVQSANKLYDATFDYDVANGKVIQEAVIELAKSYAYNKNAYDRAPEDPTLHARYFDNYTDRQFQTTVRIDDIRKIIANKGQGVENVVAQILSTLTAGESHEDFENTRALILNEYIPDYSTILGGTPKNLKGCIYAARNMYNHLKSDNSDLTAGAGTDEAYISSTPAKDIRVAMTESLLNLIDVGELSHIFNLEKEELFGIMVVIPDSDLPESQKYKIVVYDRKAMGRATFTYDYTNEYVAKGRFSNEYLTVSRAYFYNELFKACQLDCTNAAKLALRDLINKLPVFSKISSTDNLSETKLALNPNLTAQDVRNILDSINSGYGSSTYTTVNLFGNKDDTTKPSLYVTAGHASIICYYNGAQIAYGTGYNFSNFNAEGICTVEPLNDTVGTIEPLQANKWNGILFGVYKVEE